MSEAPAVRLTGLSKRFGRGTNLIHAVNNITLEIAPGQVYGFLGHNGAGKTTTIRMMLDLIRPSSGEVALFGWSVRGERNVLRRVGALVEGATFYNYLTARQNLEVLARTGNVHDSRRIDTLLDEVGLGKRAQEAVKGFSTGMKQRLGLAAALLSNPDLVILDEPTNGLDPEGIIEMRSVVRDLVDRQHKTVFISSHLLNEIEQICDRVAIVQRGQLVREGAVGDLLSAQSQVRLDASAPEAASTLLSPRWSVLPSNGHLLVNARREEVPELLRMLVQNNIDVFELVIQRQSLEDYFMAVTQQEAENGR